jgi:hypothetical protein
MSPLKPYSPLPARKVEIDFPKMDHFLEALRVVIEIIDTIYLERWMNEDSRRNLTDEVSEAEVRRWPLERLEEFLRRHHYEYDSDQFTWIKKEMEVKDE